MTTLNIKELINSDIAISYKSGDKLYQFLKPELETGDGNVIFLDFKDITMYATPFFNASIGYLLKDIELIILQKRLKFNNMSEIGRYTLNKVIENALHYYQNSQLIDDVIKERD